MQEEVVDPDLAVRTAVSGLTQSLLFGRNFGIGTDIQTGPDGDLHVVSNSLGSVFEIFRETGQHHR